MARMHRALPLGALIALWAFGQLAVAGCAAGASPVAAGPADAGAAPPPAAEAAPSAPAIAERVVEGGKLHAAWTDLGWAPHTLAPGKPVRIDFAKGAGWVLARSGAPAKVGGVLVRYRAPQALGDLLTLGLDGRQVNGLKKVLLSSGRRAAVDGLQEAWLSLAVLSPEGQPFERLVLSLAKPLEPAVVEVELLALTANSPPVVRSTAGARRPSRSVSVKIDCRKAEPISPLIYGVAFGPEEVAAELGATARRWGGNTTSRYNWRLGDAWNTGNDWFFRNVAITPKNPTWVAFLAENQRRALSTAFTLPLIGWVAKDTDSCSFPKAEFPEQAKWDPQGIGCGDGNDPSGVALVPPPPSRTSVAAPPAFVEEWVTAIRTADLQRSASLYILDNEPSLWHLTHRDVHPERLGYDELLQRTIDYATAVRAADPQAKIAGLAAWGWSALFFSAADRADGKSFVPTDRLAHGGKALLPWWLSQLRAHEKKTGVRLVDLVDVHFYPQGAGIGLYGDGWTDLDTSARRIRSVRALWDPGYVDESWIGEPIKLLPRLQAWIDEEYPGTGIEIGEYNFGAENHVSGGLAVAEALGRFGVGRVHSAFYWAQPPRGSAAYWAFRAFRNYDGLGGRFGEQSLEVAQPKGLSSVFASRRSDGALVVVALNHDFANDIELKVEAAACGPLRLQRLFTNEGGHDLVEDAAQAGASTVRLGPASVNVLELLPPAAREP
jgi:Glycoside hydrolase family 44